MFAGGLWAIKITTLTAGAKRFCDPCEGLPKNRSLRYSKIFSANNKFVTDEYQQISHKILFQICIWPYSARETGVMQGLEKHNLTGITDAPAAFLIQLQRNFVRAFLVECSFNTH